MPSTCGHSERSKGLFLGNHPGSKVLLLAVLSQQPDIAKPSMFVIQSEILSQPDNLPMHSVVFGQREVIIFPAQWVKDVLTPEFLKLPQHGPPLAYDHDIVARFVFVIGIYEDGLSFGEDGVHRVVFHRQAECPLPWNVCNFKHHVSADRMRRLFDSDHLVKLTPGEQGDFPHLDGTGVLVVFG